VNARIIDDRNKPCSVYPAAESGREMQEIRLAKFAIVTDFKFGGEHFIEFTRALRGCKSARVRGNSAVHY